MNQETKALAPDQQIDVPVAEVLLLEDRAQVTRRGEIFLPAGDHLLVVANTSPLIADRTLLASSSATLRVDEVRVRRRWRIGAREQPKDTAELTRERTRLDRELEASEASVALRRHRDQQLRAAAKLYVDSVNRLTPYAEQVDSSWEQDLSALIEDDQAAALSLLEARAEQEALEREAAALDLHGGLRRRPDQHLAAWLELAVHVDEAGEFPLEIEYTVPCALWRPIHRATLRGEKLQFEGEAAVWQNTGEDWGDVLLRFSTARSTQRAEPPLLEDDLLRTRRKTEKKVVVGVRETAIASTGEGASTQAEGLPGVDDGGVTRLLEARVQTSVPSDGLMRRVAVFTFEVEVELDRFCCPEFEPLVHLRSRQTNSAPQPLLAGPVDLVRDSGYVGRTQLDFVAPGERFALGWGSDDALRIRRESHEHRETAKLSGKLNVRRRVELFLSNLDASEARFTVEERVPVSEIDKVKVAVDDKETRPLQAPDKHGIVRWQVTLPPHGTDELKLGYTLTASSDVQGI